MGTRAGLTCRAAFAVVMFAAAVTYAVRAAAVIASVGIDANEAIRIVQAALSNGIAAS